MLSWNGREDTLACLTSLQQSDYPALTIVVVDNASSDGSAAAVREQHPDLTLLENRANLRWAGGNNVGIRYAMAQGADYILLLNNDTEVGPRMVSSVVAAAEASPDVGLLGPKIYYHASPELIWFAGGTARLKRGRFWHMGIRQKDDGQFAAPAPADFITGCAMLIRREVIETIGEIDIAYYLYGEDVDYSLRAAAAGYRLMMIPEAVMWHKVSASLGATSGSKIRHRLRSQLRLYRRYAPPWAWFSTIPLFLLLDGLRVLALLAAGRLSALGGKR